MSSHVHREFFKFDPQPNSPTKNCHSNLGLNKEPPNSFETK